MKRIKNMFTQHPETISTLSRLGLLVPNYPFVDFMPSNQSFQEVKI